MKILFILCALSGVHSTTYILTEGPHGLITRLRMSATRYKSVLLSSQNSILSSMMIPAGNTTERLLVFPIGPQSQYASRTNSTMILPPSESHPYFRMFENPTDSRINCFAATMGVVEMYPGAHLGFVASVGLIPSAYDINSTWAMHEEAAATPDPFTLSTVCHFDVIPRRIYNIILGEIARLGVQTAEDENINLLPSIEYTVYRSRYSADAVVRIVSLPRDYLQFTSGRMRLMILPTEYGPLGIGINTLKHIGVLIDYRQRQIGFCEPI